jgi:regulatory protein
MKDTDIATITDRMRRMCSRREYCTSDILKKVSDALGGDREVASKVLEKLVAERYVDNLRYATAYARDKAMISGWGETKIRYMLSGKGIDREVITKALEEIDEGKAVIRLEKLLENKWRVLKDDPQARIKMLRFALGRGYQYDEVISVIDSIRLEK